MSKLAVSEVVLRHVGTLSKPNETRARTPDIVLMYGVPLAVGLGAWVVSALTGWVLPDTSAMLAGVCLIAGAMFGLATFVFGLRMKTTEDSSQRSVKSRLDELFSNVLYAAMVGVISAGAVMVTGFFRVPAVAGEAGGLDPIAFGVAAVFVIHLGLTLLMVIKRILRAYQALNG